MRQLVENLKNKLGLILIEEGDYEGGSYICSARGIKIPNRHDHMGYYGPYYQITKCSDRDFKFLKLNNRNNCYKSKDLELPYKICKSEFKKYCLME